ncbi:AI-2E family transporter [Crassaminicella profunda]|uniref:AI-2E family transporter n=1 Tax=Crassaminicella profunda TaxID=1286698 RepID=UPI001CA79CC7|nr:AI-2E family transporter [Crassaminicella profunda]QZY55920.1 AI-2E family transporter [Crassaminicella profunda]
MKHYRKSHYFNMILVIIISYIGIKFIDHFDIVRMKLNQFIKLIYPFIISFLVAYILSPAISFLEKRFKLKRGQSIFITYMGIIGVILIFISFIFPIITNSILDLFKNIPKFSTTAQNYFDQLVENNKLLDVGHLSEVVQNNVRSYIPKLSNVLMNTLDILLKGTLSFTASFLSTLIGFIISIYVLFDKEKFALFGKKLTYILLKKENGDRLLSFGKTLHKMIVIYIGAKSLDSAIIGSIAFMGMLFLKAKYALLLALIVGITNMIPYVGPFIGMSIACVINLFYSPMTALWLLIFLILLQQFDGWYLDPKLTGGKVGMNPFLAILSVALGGGFFGILGMILGIPIMAVIKIYVDDFVERKGPGHL